MIQREEEFPHVCARVCVCVLLDYRDEWMLSVAQGEGNTFHSSYQFLD